MYECHFRNSGYAGKNENFVFQTKYIRTVNATKARQVCHFAEIRRVAGYDQLEYGAADKQEQSVLANVD